MNGCLDGDDDEDNNDRDDPFFMRRRALSLLECGQLLAAGCTSAKLSFGRSYPCMRWLVVGCCCGCNPCCCQPLGGGTVVVRLSGIGLDDSLMPGLSGTVVVRLSVLELLRLLLLRSLISCIL